jgi:hypothetical protein
LHSESGTLAEKDEKDYKGDESSRWRAIRFVGDGKYTNKQNRGAKEFLEKASGYMYRDIGRKKSGSERK